jgi:hypothetical protein
MTSDRFQTAFDRFQTATVLIAEGRTHAAQRELERAIRWIDRTGRDTAMRSDLVALYDSITTPRPVELPAACDFVTGDRFEHRELVRHNWSRIGYEYWFTRDMIEHWRHPVNGHVAELTIY